MLRKLLRQRKSFLQRIISQCNRWLAKSPSGSLSISCSRGIAAFYQTSGTKTRRRLSKTKDSLLIQSLAKKDYYSSLIPIAENELNTIERLLEIKDNQTLGKVYQNLHHERQKLVTPVEETRERTIQQWVDMPYPPSEPESGKYYIPTERGEMVRSMNEYMIANALFHHGIPYKYEYPYEAINGKTLHPDFFVKNKSTGDEFFWEHFGMMDNPEYVMNSFMYKTNLYSADGFFLGKNLIVTFSGGKYSLDEETINRIIKEYLL